MPSAVSQNTGSCCLCRECRCVCRVHNACWPPARTSERSDHLFQSCPARQDSSWPSRNIASTLPCPQRRVSFRERNTTRDTQPRGPRHALHALWDDSRCNHRRPRAHLLLRTVRPRFLPLVHDKDDTATALTPFHAPRYPHSTRRLVRRLELQYACSIGRQRYSRRVAGSHPRPVVSMQLCLE